MAIPEKDKKSRAYYKRNIKRIFLELYGTDEDIKEHLEKKKEAGEPVSTYIKRIIREDMKNGG